MGSQLKILFVDDNPDDVDMIVRHIVRARFEVHFTQVCDLEALAAELRNGSDFDVIICEHDLPGFDSEDVLRLLNRNDWLEIPAILVSGTVDTATAVASMRHGASDYIFKNDLSRLIPAIRRQLEACEVRRKKIAAELALEESNRKLTGALKSLANTQDQLVAAERFRALGQMSSGIAHDFNNALMKMQGTMELLKIRVPDGDSLYSQLEVQIGDAATVVRRLCDFYRTSPAANETAVELGAVLADTKEFTRPKWMHGDEGDATAIVLEVHHEAKQLAWICPSQFREVLTNLIFNACDAIEGPDGRIELISRSLEDEGTVEVEIRDNGSGMKKEVLARCLEPLYSTKGNEGTGLGLAIVQSTIQSYGGSVRVESEVGKGTSIIITLRAAEVASEDSGESGEPATAPVCNLDRNTALRRLKVLTVDDEPAIGMMLQRYLERLGHDAVAVADPEEVVRMIASDFYDVVLSDRSMPQMSGDELALKVREISPDTRFVMISGYGDLMLTNSELPDGVDMIVPKPISGDVLQEALDSVCPPADAGEQVALSS